LGWEGHLKPTQKILSQKSEEKNQRFEFRRIKRLHGQKYTISKFRLGRKLQLMTDKWLILC
jgi:hypothetical protein